MLFCMDLTNPFRFSFGRHPGTAALRIHPDSGTALYYTHAKSPCQTAFSGSYLYNMHRHMPAFRVKIPNWVPRFGTGRTCPRPALVWEFSTKLSPFSGTPALVWYNSPRFIPIPYNFVNSKSLCMFLREFCASRQKLQDCNPHFRPKKSLKPPKNMPIRGNRHEYL